MAARLFQARQDPPAIPAGFPPHLRYLRPIASGASGEVHRASDPALDRPVAVKLLRSRSDPDDLRRLHREARTLARLAHPHVVVVYEVGEHDGFVFLVMEYVDGGSLLERQRSRAQPFALAAIVTAYLEAAEGLAAAHAAGIVHRDVKPANLLVGSDGRVRVADFGLAHPIDEVTDPQDVSSPEHPSHAPASDDAPLHGAALPPPATESRLARGGTPAYMAPETMREGVADARSDQFSWAVSFYEALYGQRPPRRSKLGNRAVAPPVRAMSGERVPAYLRDVLVCALAHDPADRAPTLTPLIAALHTGPARLRRRRAVVLGSALVLAASGTAYAVALSRTACPSPDGLLDGTWDRSIASRVEAALSSSPLPFAAPSTTYTIDSLDDYGRRWSEARVEACQLTRTRAVRSDSFLELANACLDARRAQLDALVQQLSTGSPDVIANVTDLVATLAPVEPCTNPAALEEGREAAFDPALADELRKIRDELARARITFARGLHAEAQRLVDDANAAARATGSSLIVAEALLTKGGFLREMGDGGQASTILVEALDAAEAADARTVKAEALLVLVAADAELNERLEQSSYHLDRAHAALLRLGHDPDEHVGWLVARASRDALAGEVAGAEAALRSAIEHHGDAASVDSAILLSGVARHIELDRPAEARAHYQQAQATLTDLLGADHPKTVNVGFNLGLLDRNELRLDEAADAFERMRAAVTASQGADAPRLAVVHAALADLSIARGDPQRALVEGARALAIEAALVFQEPSVVAAAHTAMSNAEDMLGNAERSLEHALAALRLQEARLSPRELAELRINVGELLCRIDRCAEARPYYAAAADAVRSATDPQGRKLLAYAMNGTGKAALRARTYAEATSAFLVAHEIGMRDLEGADALLNAEVQWGLARARAALGARDEAEAHAAVAFAACVAGGNDVGTALLDGSFSTSPCAARRDPQ